MVASDADLDAKLEVGKTRERWKRGFQAGGLNVILRELESRGGGLITAVGTSPQVDSAVTKMAF